MCLKTLRSTFRTEPQKYEPSCERKVVSINSSSHGRLVNRTHKHLDSLVGEIGAGELDEAKEARVKACTLPLSINVDPKPDSRVEWNERDTNRGSAGE